MGRHRAIAGVLFDRVGVASMTGGSSKTFIGALLLLASAWPSVGSPAEARTAKSHPVDFLHDDGQAQRIAKRALGKDFSEEEDAPSGANSLRTAWVKLSPGRAPALLVMYGCSPTGNCGLYGFERAKSGWRQILNSLAQMCSILPSSHGGRRDISAYMHGSATDGILKTYRWRRNRYVQVSERGIVFK
jgi:hypothetical protein